jgi:hypothetical protein
LKVGIGEFETLVRGRLKVGIGEFETLVRGGKNSLMTNPRIDERINTPMTIRNAFVGP